MEDYNFFVNPCTTVRLGADCSSRILYNRTIFSLSRLASRKVDCKHICDKFQINFKLKKFQISSTSVEFVLQYILLLLEHFEFMF